MNVRRPLAANELGDARPDEQAAALLAAAALERTIIDAPTATRPDFVDGVMAALVDEPAPSPTGFLAPLRRLGPIAGFAASVRQARVAVGGGRPMLGRAAALAYVLAVAIAGTSLVGATTVSVAGALGILGPAPTQSPTPTTGPAPTGDIVSSPAPSLPSADPQASDEPTASPDASDDHGGGSGPEPSSDDGAGGGTSGSDGGDDSSGSRSDGSGTPRPTDTPRPTGTPKPTETPH